MPDSTTNTTLSYSPGFIPHFCCPVMSTPPGLSHLLRYYCYVGEWDNVAKHDSLVSWIVPAVAHEPISIPVTILYRCTPVKLVAFLSWSTQIPACFSFFFVFLDWGPSKWVAASLPRGFTSLLHRHLVLVCNSLLRWCTFSSFFFSLYLE